ncbi:MAG: ribonucleoside triphosphate reductase [bacterium]
MSDATNISKIRKRDGQIVDFDQDKIIKALKKALSATGEKEGKAKFLSEQVVKELNKKFHYRSIPAVEEVQDIVEEALIKNREIKTAKAYILYRDQHAKLREYESLVNSDEIMEGYLKQLDWRVKENSNMAFSLQGLNIHVSTAVSTHYWLNKIYSPAICDAHLGGDIHVHDLYLLAPYCCGWDLKDLLIKGFSGVESKVECKPPKHFRTALGQVVNFFYTLQGEAAGAMAFAGFDTYLAPFIRYDDLGYKQVKQCVQGFVFNMNVPTRVGFQCMSQDTEILGKDGWKKYNQIKVGDVIATFNTEKGNIEYLPTKKIFAKEYKGKMYNLKNRISDQLISPRHRVVRKKFGGSGYVLDEIENILKLKSPVITPVGSDGNIKGNNNIPEDVVKLIAWVVSEGTLDKGERGSGRISIYQSKIKSNVNYKEIINICKNLGLTYTEREQSGLGEKCEVIRFDARSTRQILKYFKTDKNKGIKFIPQNIINSGVKISQLFLETYIKGDGYEDCKILTASEVIRDGLMQIIVNAGFGGVVSTRKPDNQLSKKDRYIIRIIKHKDTYINKIEEVDYQGVIWCPNTDNETVIARRNGKIFITGNTPFTNITMDLVVPKNVAEENIIIGGKPQDEKYGEFQTEMDMFNKAFAEVMIEGDAKGRVFTFPIPTYNISKNFNWDNPILDRVWEMTAKYGIPYFANFVNSDMNPEDARSMCCRLRLDNRELRKRGGGLFAANPLTGSLGVVTINLPRIAYLSNKNSSSAQEAKAKFYERLEKMMLLAKESLEVKRKVIERFSEQGLYPYSKVYLSGIKERFGEYWKNHFNTVGIIGMNEACLNLFGKDLTDDESHNFAIEVMSFMRSKLMDYQIETDQLFNLEATPAEGASYRFAREDKRQFPDIMVANEEAIREHGAEPYYTNSTHLPVDFTDDIFEALDRQDELQTMYTGGTVLHGFIGERLSAESTKRLVKKIAENYHLPYYTVTPTFSVCPKHGYLAGEHFYCPKCDEEMGYAEGVVEVVEEIVAEGA